MIILLRQCIGFLFFATITHAAIAVEEIEGSSDFPNVGRVADSVMIGYDIQEYGEGLFIKGIKKGSSNSKKQFNKTIEKQYVEGALSSYIYVLKSGQSPLLAIKNYQEGFAELGDVTNVYSCRSDECDSGLGEYFSWTKGRRFKTNNRDLNTAFAVRSYYQGQRYWFATVKSESADYAVSVYAAQVSNTRKFKHLNANDTIVRVDVVTNKAFEKNLEVVDASAIEAKISQTGFIDLYGLYFDTGSHTLKESSVPAMSEIVKYLQANPSISLYVVGHTDSDGSLELNQSLSQRRAQEVVGRLVSENGIDTSRLKGIGVGLATPIASNDTEEGKALNRRVVLVKNK